MKNAITDVPGLRVGSADDSRVASGVTVVVFDESAVASGTVQGGAPAGHDTAMLDPVMTVERIDAITLSGGSVYGLEAAAGVKSCLAEQGRGFAIGPIKVPIVPGAAIFDLLNGGDKAWGRRPPYFDLGYAAAASAAHDFALGSVGAGLGATTVDLKGGLGTASAVTSAGFIVGALAVVNAVGRATLGSSPHFWAQPFERDGEFGGLARPAVLPADALSFRLKGDAPTNTTLCVVATDARLSKPLLARVAIMAHDGLALSLRPAHAPMDGDTVFAASTAKARKANLRDVAEIGLLAAECVARAVARGVYEAKALPFPGALPDWRTRRQAPML
jgi:D-aminopeptidase